MPIRNAKRPTMTSEGEIVGLNDKEKQILEDAGIAGGDFKIPEITLIPTSMEPITGTVTSEQLSIIQNNDIIKFNFPSYAESCAFKMKSLSSSSANEIYFTLQFGRIVYNLVIFIEQSTFKLFIVNISLGASYSNSQTVATNWVGLCNDSSELASVFSKVSGEQLREVIGYKSETEPLGKYTISEDGDTLVITENW